MSRGAFSGWGRPNSLKNRLLLILIVVVVVFAIANGDVDSHPRMDAALPAGDAERQHGRSGKRTSFGRGGFDKLICVRFGLRRERAIREDAGTFGSWRGIASAGIQRIEEAATVFRNFGERVGFAANVFERDAIARLEL